MSTSVERYQNLRLKESLPKVDRYPMACQELSTILRESYNKVPKPVQIMIFNDILKAFRLLPEFNFQSANSSGHLLVQSVEAVLPRQKKNYAVKEYKQAIVAQKRRCKAQQEGEGSTELPHDILMLICCFLDIKSLAHVGQVCRSWNLAANENNVWKSHYVAIHGGSVQDQLISPGEDRKYPLPKDPIDTRLNVDWKEAVKRSYAENFKGRLRSNRGYCGRCRRIVWLNYSKCVNDHFGIIPRFEHITPLTASQVAGYLVFQSSSSSSSSDSDSDTEGPLIRIRRFWS